MNSAPSKPRVADLQLRGSAGPLRLGVSWPVAASDDGGRYGARLRQAGVEVDEVTPDGAPAALRRALRRAR